MSLNKETQPIYLSFEYAAANTYLNRKSIEVHFHLWDQIKKKERKVLG